MCSATLSPQSDLIVGSHGSQRLRGLDSWQATQLGRFAPRDLAELLDVSQYHLFATVRVDRC